MGLTRRSATALGNLSSQNNHESAVRCTGWLDLMRLLYWLSYIPTAPFWALSWMLYGASYALRWAGNTLHDATTYRAWLVLHRRECERLQAQRSNEKLTD